MNIAKTANNKEAQTLLSQSIIWILALGIGITAPFLGEAAGFPLIFAVLLLATLMLLGLFPLFERDFSFFHPLYMVLVTFAIGYAARSLFFMFGNYEWMLGFTSVDARTYLSRALAVAALGTFSLLVGYKGSLGQIVADKIPVLPTTIRPRRLIFLTFVYLGIGCFLYRSFLLSASTGAGLSLQALITQQPSSNLQFLFVGSRLIYVGVFTGLVYYIKVRPFPVWWIFLLIALLVPLFNNARSELLIVVVGILTIFNFLVRKLLARHIVVISILLLMISIVLLSVRNARTVGFETVQRGFDSSNLIGHTVGGRSFADITTLAHIIRYSENNGTRYGETFLFAATRFIPRTLWSEKPENLGNEVSRLFFNEALGRPDESRAGVPASLIAELYWNFHLPGVIGGMFFFGVFIRVIFVYLSKSSTNIWTILIYAVSLIYVFEQASIPFSSAAFRYLQLIAPLVFAAIFVSNSRTKI